MVQLGVPRWLWHTHGTTCWAGLICPLPAPCDRYEVNYPYVEALQEAGLHFVGTDESVGARVSSGFIRASNGFSYYGFYIIIIRVS